MKRTFQTLVAVVALALLGVLAGVALAGMSSTPSASDPVTDPATAAVTLATTTDAPTTDAATTDAATTEPARTTEPATTTDAAPTTGAATTTAAAATTAPATTTAAVTTAPATTTAAATTVAPATTAATTDSPATTTAPATGGVTQATPQTTAAPAVTPGDTTARTQTQPCQTPSNPGVTCGNNAATQLAVVTQNCKSDATVATTGLTVQILNADGTVAKTVGIDNKSICLNYSQITQIVQQICVNCTLVVQNYYSTTNQHQTIVTGWTGPRYVGYCMPADRPRDRGDGTVGWLVFVEEGRPDWDPAYRGATRAPFDPSAGYTCPGTASAAVPNTFTLTVPAAFIGQFVNLCLQPADPKAKPVCHSMKIDGSSKFTIPVRSNIKASITPKPKSKLVTRTHTNAAAGLLRPHAKKRCAVDAKTHKRHCVSTNPKRRTK
jgi:hypothetical protein